MTSPRRYLQEPGQGISGVVNRSKILTFGGAQDMDRIEFLHAVVDCDWNKELLRARPVDGPDMSPPLADRIW